MADFFFWMCIVVAVLIYPVYRLGQYVWEKFFLTSEERWRRKYDRRMKNFFKGI